MIFRDEHLKLIGKLIYENISFEVDSYDGSIPMDKITINDTFNIVVWYYDDAKGADGYFEIVHTSTKGNSSLIRKTADDVIILLSNYL